VVLAFCDRYEWLIEIIIRGWNNLHNEELHIFKCSWPNIISMIKSRRMRLVDHVAYIGEVGNSYRILV
jgi:hypothetical protein